MNRTRVHVQLCLAPLILALGCQAATPTPAKKPPAPAPIKSAPTLDPNEWRRQRPLPTAPSSIELPTPQRVSLANGTELYLVPRSSGPVALSLVVRHGAADVPTGKSGLAALVARMLTEGTRKKTALQQAETAEALGCPLSTEALRDSLHLSLDVLPSDLSSGVQVLADALLSPAFSPNAFQRIRQEWLDGLVAERQSPARLASLVGLRALLGTTRGAPVGGASPEVSALKVRDLQQWYGDCVVPEDTALIVVGPVTMPQVVEAAAGALAKATRRQASKRCAAAAADSPSVGQARIWLVDRPEAVQSALFVASPFPSFGQPGLEARQLLDNAFGGLFTSRLNRNLREVHAYTYGVRSGLVASRDFGALTAATSVRSDVTGAALSELLREWQDLRGPKAARPLSTEELDRARADRIQDLGSALEQNRRIASLIEPLFVRRQHLTSVAEEPSRLTSVGTVELAREAERLVPPDQLVLVVVGDARTVRPQLETLGLKLEQAPAAWLE